MRKAMRDIEVVGNFRNLFMYAPNGKPDGIKILPLSEVATKDDFFNIKKASRDDLLAAYRVPPQMMGITRTTRAASETWLRRLRCLSGMS